MCVCVFLGSGGKFLPCGVILCQFLHTEIYFDQTGELTTEGKMASAVVAEKVMGA